MIPPVLRTEWDFNSIPLPDDKVNNTLATLPLAQPLNELVRHFNDDPNELLKHRFLCTGGGLLLVGPTGIGKSSFSMQLMFMWALGFEAFNITPARPLKSLLIQAENDDGDLAEMRDGVRYGINLPDDQYKRACANIIVCREDARTGRQFFDETVRPLLEEHRPDLLWIDPALAYLGGENISQKDVGGFLRNMLNPLLREFNCGCVVVHHTNKPVNGQEKTAPSGSDAYLGAGSAEWANWSRAIFALRSTGCHDVFELKAAKRGGRLGWYEPDGTTKSYSKHLAHAKEPGSIFWLEVDPADLPAGGKPKKGKADVLAKIPHDRPIAKEAVIQSWSGVIGVAKVSKMIKALVADGELYEWQKPRHGNRAEIYLARVSQSVVNGEPVFVEVITAALPDPTACGNEPSGSISSGSINQNARCDYLSDAKAVVSAPLIYKGANTTATTANTTGQPKDQLNACHDHHSRITESNCQTGVISTQRVSVAKPYPGKVQNTRPVSIITPLHSDCVQEAIKVSIENQTIAATSESQGEEVGAC